MGKISDREFVPGKADMQEAQTPTKMRRLTSPPLVELFETLEAKTLSN